MSVAMPLSLEILSIRHPLSKDYNGIVGRVTKRLGNKYVALLLGLDPSSWLFLSGQIRQKARRSRIFIVMLELGVWRDLK